MSLTSLYRCPDGTEFPVTWEQPEDAQKVWKWEQEHAPEPMKPMDLAIGKLAAPGVSRAFAEAEVPVPALFRGGRNANGFLYTPAELALPTDEQRELYEAVDRLIEREGGVLEVWERFCLPRIDAAYARVQRAPENAPLAEVADAYGYGVRLTHVAGSFALFASILNWFIQLGEDLGMDGRLLVGELAQGHASTTLLGNDALWELARVADRSPAVRAALLDDAVEAAWEAIRALDDSTDFVVAFEAYLEQYGGRAGTWHLSSPTWREDPSAPLRLIRRMIEEKTPSPETSLAEGAQRRESVRREIERRLTGDGARLREFREMAKPLEHYIPIREGRAFWQLAMMGALRDHLLKRGSRLVECGAIQESEDVLYLLPEEIEGDTSDDLSPTMEERRRTWEFWSKRKPPAIIGGQGESRDREATTEPEGGVIRGIAASRGVVTARARVLFGIDDAGLLQRGEVLVCAMSSPPWTPLFAVASGVVTDSGGILSHPAIVAREYGIPCVVGTRIGTELIRDGAMITVDGDAGTVRIER